MDRTTTIVNLFAGPGAGKSTLAAFLFSIMKARGYEVELVPKYFKDLAWDGHIPSDKLYNFSQQRHRILRVVGKVDFAIVDSPILLTLAYDSDEPIPWDHTQLALACHNQYPSLNLFIARNPSFVFSENGRFHTLEEAQVLDMYIRNTLNLYRIPYHTLPVGFSPKQVADLVFQKLKLV